MVNVTAGVTIRTRAQQKRPGLEPTPWSNSTPVPILLLSERQVSQDCMVI
uniref:Uncharacterized protein n=1 Tax=Romanomermis culicivorax TaxID=13658 RepID=A0A915L1C4_ROMCU